MTNITEILCCNCGAKVAVETEILCCNCGAKVAVEGEKGAARMIDHSQLDGYLQDMAIQAKKLTKAIITEMDRIYPKGTEIRFWRTARQINPSYGVVVYNTFNLVPTCRVRYRDGDHKVSLYYGITRFEVVKKNE